MKKILILGAGEYQVPIIKKAKENKLYTIVVSPAGEYPGLTVADKVYFFDVRDKARILDIAIKEKIDGVLTDQTDLPVSTVAYIAEKLGLPGIGHKVSILFSNKFLMREKCREIGISVLKYELADKISRAQKFCKTTGFPVVIKPVDSQGSRGVYKICSKHDLEKYFKISQNYSSNHGVLLEEFIEGYEFIVDSLVIDHNYQNLAIGDSYYFNLKNSFISNKRLFPTIHSKQITDRIIELDKKIIDAFGLTQGITFGEYLLDKKTKNIYLLEIGARGQGAYISSDLIPELTNIDLSNLILDFALGEKVQPDIQKVKNVVAGYIALYLPVGKVVGIEGPDEIDSYNGILRHNLYSIKLNQLIKSFENKSSRKIILIKSTNRRKLNELIRKIKGTLNIKVETKEGIKGVIWD